MTETSDHPSRMEELAVLPIFYKLTGRTVLLAGGSEPAVWKADLLSAAGAHVRVCAAAPCADLLALAAASARGSIELVPRHWVEDDLKNVAMAVGAIEDEEEALYFAAAAHRAGVPVNIIDKPAHCDFQFGTIVARSPLVIGISTDGAAPVFGQAIRTRIEAVLPQGLRAWAQAARDWRPRVQARHLGFRARRRFWEVFSRFALADDRTPGEAAFQSCMEAADPALPALARPSVSFVCAGPGKAEAITLAAIAALQSADVILYESDVPDLVIGYGRREAHKVMVADPEALKTLATLVGEGQNVAWLATGNPEICRRWIQRRAAVAALSVPLSSVPGLGLCPECGPHCPAWPRTPVD